LLAFEPNLYTGDGGAGKTTLAENLGIAIPAGVPLLGAETLQMPVFLLVAEDRYGPVRDNMLSIRQALGVPEETIKLVHLLSVKSDRITNGHVLARIDDDGVVTSTAFAKECIYPHLFRLAASHPNGALWVIDPLEDLVSLNRNKDAAAGALSRRWLAEICRQRVTVLVNDHPSKASMASGANYGGSVQIKNGFPFAATIIKGDKTWSGTASQRELTFEILKGRYTDEADFTFYRVGKSPAFSLHRAAGLALADNMARVFAYVEERRASGAVSAHVEDAYAARCHANNLGQHHGPALIGEALELPEVYVKDAIKALCGLGVYVSKKLDLRGKPPRDPGGLLPGDRFSLCEPPGGVPLDGEFFHDLLRGFGHPEVTQPNGERDRRPPY